MRKTASWLVVCAGLLASSASWASASYANRSVGFGVGGFKLVGDINEPISWAIPFHLEGTLYVENGFDVYLKLQFLLMNQTAGVVAGGGGGLVVGGGGQFGVRYFFSEESLRPFVGIHAAYLFINRPDGTGDKNYAGAGAQVGLDYFVGESVSIGARVFSDFYYTLNRPLLVGLGGNAVISVYF